jgi:hypothetical protein
LNLPFVVRELLELRDALLHSECAGSVIWQRFTEPFVVGARAPNRGDEVRTDCTLLVLYAEMWHHPWRGSMNLMYWFARFRAPNANGSGKRSFLRCNVPLPTETCCRGVAVAWKRRVA